MDGQLPSSSNRTAQCIDVSLSQGQLHRQVCAFCMSLSHPEVRPSNPATFDESGTLNFEGSSRGKAELEHAASMGCARCRLILDGLKLYSRSLGPGPQDFIVHDHVKMRENGNAMGVQIVSSPTTKSSKVLNLVFHVTFLRKIGPKVCHSDLPLFEKSWLTTQHWQPAQMPMSLAFSFPLPFANLERLLPNIEEGDFGRPVYECNDSPAVFECIQAWLQQCDSEHESCRARNTQHVPLPTRLLDVESDDICLIETTEYQQGTYVCLSHCWGGYQPIRTLQGNIERHKSAIPWDCLPKTFQDAVTIVRKTGLRYLWIDSLCIIQDSTSDWRAEAARMADIYSRAYFTIGALSANNSQEGCFPAPNHKYEAHPLAAVSFEGKRASIFVRQDHGHPGDQLMSQVTVLQRGPSQPLLDRAWVFQERNLSLRVVYFGKTEIFWECSTAGYCGCRPGIRRDPDRPACIQTEPWLKWQLMVNMYRRLSLTMIKDTFPALSGLARAFQRDNKGLGRYLAGHWEAHLPRCLAWTAREGRTAGTDWRAPSWSWASVASAEYNMNEVEPACSVVAVECRQAGIDPYGELEAVGSSCWLELSGRLFPGTLTYRDGPHGRWHIDMRTTYGHGYFSDDLDFKSTGSPDAIPPGGSLELLCLHLGVRKGKDELQGDEDVFLALRQFQNSSEFERVGLVRFNQRHGKIFPDGQLYSQKEVTVRIN